LSRSFTRSILVRVSLCVRVDFTSPRAGFSERYSSSTAKPKSACSDRAPARLSPSVPGWAEMKSFRSALVIVVRYRSPNCGRIPDGSFARANEPAETHDLFVHRQAFLNEADWRVACCTRGTRLRIQKVEMKNGRGLRAVGVSVIS
jgi:hypothetical protein